MLDNALLLAELGGIYFGILVICIIPSVMLAEAQARKHRKW